jgi:tetratricopeptide (TPR) repeat protein
MPPLPVWPNRADALLREIPGEVIAIELWIQLRHLRDWLAFPNNPPADLFNPLPSERVLARRADALASAPNGFADALRTFHSLTDGSILPEQSLALACVRVADWALEQGQTATAMQFTAAGARAAPNDPTCLNAAGLAHRRGGEWECAELYYQRAAYTANEQKNANEHASAHIGLAALWSARGQHRRAQRHLGRATNIAQRSGSTWLGAHVQHDLMLLLTERQEYSQAETAAARAAFLYPVNDSRFPFFAADFAFLQLAQGYYSDAVPALEQFLSMIQSPAQQVIGLSLLARAYAGTGRIADFSHVRERVEELIEVYTTDAAAALFHLAEAARCMEEWPEAARYAELSRLSALERGDRAVAQYAAALCAAIHRQERPARPGPRTASGDRPAVARTLSARLRRWNPDSRRGRNRRPRRNHWGHF